MSSCDKYDGLIERLLADEMGHGDRDLLLEHGESCERCRSFIDLHYRLEESDLEVDLPTEAAFAGMRRQVLAELDRSRRPVWVRWLGLDTVVRPAFAGALAALLLLAVFFAGWRLGLSGGSELVPVNDTMIAGMLQEARDNRVLTDAENSPYIYSNVVYQPSDAGRVALRFDVTRHLEIDRPADDPLVQEVLVHSLINPSPVGTRLQALAHADGMNPKLKEALIFTLLNDESQAVRMRALELLGDHATDTDIQEALLLVLQGDEAVHLRLKAIDLIAAAGSDERLGEVLEELDQRDDRAVLMRAASYRPGDVSGRRRALP